MDTASQVLHLPLRRDLDESWEASDFPLPRGLGQGSIVADTSKCENRIPSHAWREGVLVQSDVVLHFLRFNDGDSKASGRFVDDHFSLHHAERDALLTQRVVGHALMRLRMLRETLGNFRKTDMGSPK